jgi:carotenoid 1,2-hydratase
VSDDGRHAITLIAFVGSVFSPYYALARRLQRGDPSNHCAINVALYGASGKRWAMTERSRADLVRGARSLRVGPSEFQWSDREVKIHLDERTVPFSTRIRGEVTLRVDTPPFAPVMLDSAGRHVWRPLCPNTRIEVVLEKPDLSWTGTAYFDRNFGSEPLENAFSHWTWSRAHHGDETTVLYDVFRRDGSHLSLARKYYADGSIVDFVPPGEQALPITFWRVHRTGRSDDGAAPRLVQTLEDTPFYARSMVESTIEGQKLTAIHESLSLNRVANPVVRFMLPFKMPRRARRFSGA